MDKFFSKRPVSTFFQKPSASVTTKVDNPEKKMTEKMIQEQAANPFLSSTFSHKSSNLWESYQDYDNFLISKSIFENPEGGKVLISSGMFEVRWGSNATSERMPNPPSSGIIQVNLTSGNTRIVRWNENQIEVEDSKIPAEKPCVKRAVSTDLETPSKKPKVISPSKSGSSSLSGESSNDGSPAMTIPNTSQPSPILSSENGGGSKVNGSPDGIAANDIGPVTCCNWEDTKSCEEWCEKLSANMTDGVLLAVGLDCEWCAPWWAKPFGDAIQTIQLYHPAVGSLVYSTGCGDEKNKQDSALPSNLRALLENKDVIKVGVNVHGDTCRIANTFRCNVLSAYNLMNKSESGIKRSSTGSSSKSKSSGSGASLEQMSKNHCPPHLQLDKKSDGSKVRMGDWSQWPLSSDQQYYAAMDAVVSFWIFSSLMGCKWPQQREKLIPCSSIGSGLDLKDATPSKPNELKRAASDPGLGEEGEEEGEGKVSGVSFKAAANAAFFMMHRNKSIKPPQAGIKEHPKGPPNCLKGCVVVVSGVLDSFNRKEFEEYITSHGGSVVKGISKKITHLVNDHGEIGPSKKAKCLEMKVDIVGEDFFLDKVRAAM